MDSTAILKCVELVTAKWTKQRRAEERGRARRSRAAALMMRRSSRLTFKDAAWEVMEEAYLKASSSGKLPALARQIYYAARPTILEKTGEQALNSNYFTQRLLPDFVAEYAEARTWDIVYDARGHIQEPHTRLIVPLGTLDVREYLADIRDHVVPEVSSLFSLDNRSRRFPTCGPTNRFSAILFVEKEGFMPLFERVRLPDRYDIAIMSTKGMPVIRVGLPVVSLLLCGRACGHCSAPVISLFPVSVGGSLCLIPCAPGQPWAKLSTGLPRTRCPGLSKSP